MEWAAEKYAECGSQGNSIDYDTHVIWMQFSELDDISKVSIGIKPITACGIRGRSERKVVKTALPNRHNADTVMFTFTASPANESMQN